MSFWLVTIFIVSALSLISYVYCWQDIHNGRPHITSLRQLTHIMDRNLLNQLFGEPKPGYVYELPPPVLRALVQWKRPFFIQEVLADGLCAYGAYRYMTVDTHPDFVLWFVLLAGVCQGIDLLHSFWLVRRWWHQISEEFEEP